MARSNAIFLEPDDVRQMRLETGESQFVFGQRFGVHYTTIGRWERRGVPVKGTAAHVLRELRKHLNKSTAHAHKEEPVPPVVQEPAQ